MSCLSIANSRLALPSIISEVDKIFINILRLLHTQKVEAVLKDWLDEAGGEEYCQKPSVEKIGNTHFGIATNPLKCRDLFLLTLIKLIADTSQT